MSIQTSDLAIFQARLTGAGVAIASGKTFTLSNTLTLTGTDGSTLNVGVGGTLGSNAFTSTTYAPLASPTLTGTPTAPTAAGGTNTTQLATTAFVGSALSGLTAIPGLTTDGIVFTSGGNGTLNTGWTIAPDNAATGTSISITAGRATTTGNPGGSITIQGGNGDGITTKGGDVTLLAGNAIGGAGNIILGSASAENWPGVTIFGVANAANADAAEGVVGEFISATLPEGSAVPLFSGDISSVVSVELTSYYGDWDIEGNINFIGTSATVSQEVACINITGDTMNTDGTQVYSSINTTLGSAINSITIPRTRISALGGASAFLVCQATFSAGSVSVFGSISARRVR